MRIKTRIKAGEISWKSCCFNPNQRDDAGRSVCVPSRFARTCPANNTDPNAWCTAFSTHPYWPGRQGHCQTMS